MILTEIGEVGVHTETLDIIFRPSFQAISRLGAPEEIVELSRRIYENPTVREAAYILYTCLYGNYTPQELEIIYDTIGCHKPVAINGAERLKWVKGELPEANLILLAQSMIYNGVIGKVDKKITSADKASYSSSFNTREYVATAIAHLGVSEAEAWGMTMTGFLDAMMAKYPAIVDDTRDRLKQAEEFDNWFDEVSALRQAEEG